MSRRASTLLLTQVGYYCVMHQRRRAQRTGPRRRLSVYLREPTRELLSEAAAEAGMTDSAYAEALLLEALAGEGIKPSALSADARAPALLRAS